VAERELYGTPHPRGPYPAAAVSGRRPFRDRGHALSERRIAFGPVAARSHTLLVLVMIPFLSITLLAPCVLAQDEEAIQPLAFDLSSMDEKLSTRYYISERGEVPISYLLIGGLSLRENFLEYDFDYKEEIVEYDEVSGNIFTYRIPSYIRFIKRTEREGPYFRYTVRPVTEENVDIEIATLDERVRSLRRRSLRSVILEDIRYNLQREREEEAGRGLLSLDIPIPLPRQIERIIGSGDASNLTVQGRESITIGGQSNWCANCPLTEGRPRQQKFPDLEMEQRLSVNLHGNIGEKINVEIQHSSQGDMQSVNRVRLNYKGFDDEIIKLIEMGDTDLILSGAQLISYSGSAKGLFGVKGMAQIGPLDLTVIASKEEGETATGSFSAAGGQSTSYTIADYNFIKRQFFYFETPGESFMSPNPSFYSVRPVVGGEDGVEVYVSLRKAEWGTTGEAEYRMSVYPDPENNGLHDTTTVAEGQQKDFTLFRLLLEEEGDYQLIQDYSEEGTPIYLGIRLDRPLDSDRMLAVRYKAYDRATGQTFLVGDYDDQTTLDRVGELICPRSDEFAPPASGTAPYPSTWNMMMRNVYSLGSTNMEEGSLDIRIEDLSNRPNRDIHEESGISYIRLFGLDRYDRRGLPVKDGQVDDLPEIINLSYGYIMFPWYEAFNPTYEVMTTLFDPPFIDTADSLEGQFDYDTLDRDSLIYNAVLTEAVKRDGHHYDIVVEATSGQRTFQLSAFDIIQGSEAVTVDGVKLARGTDYTIDYVNGSVTLMGDILSEMTPDSRVSIDYQHKPLIGGGKNSLLGVGANLNLSTNSRINATFVYNSVGAPKYTPRLGEEPVRTMAADVNGSFQFNPNWMTSLVNLLPRVDTDAQSFFNLNGEVAVSIPNPNVKGEAYVDDMEGIEDSDMIPMGRRAWYEASPPLDSLDYSTKLPSSAFPQFYWFNVSRELQPQLKTSRRDLNPGLDPRENSAVSSLFLRPIDPEAGDWCGIMTGFPGGGLDLTTSQYLEIWVNDFDTALVGGRGGVLHIDFGNIDEDFYMPDSISPEGRNVWNDEDAPPYTWTIEEDTGFPGETCSYPTDFSVENISPVFLTFPGINCRRGNGYHDSEDLNSNGRLDTLNTYYSFELPLDSEAIIDVQRDFDKIKYADYWDDAGENPLKAWRMYRIDLSKAVLTPPTGSEPRWDAIQHMRVWLSDIDQIDGNRGALVEIAEFKFVGNRWEFNGIRSYDDELPAENKDPLQKLVLGTINNKDNPSIYNSPYDVMEEEGLTNREQSLLMRYEYFADSTSYQAVKRFPGTGQNFQDYRDIQFFLRSDFASAGCEFYLQLAYDSTSYYEITVPLLEGEANRWQWINVNLNDLTSLKLEEPDTNGVVRSQITDGIDPSRTYGAVLSGIPTLFQVKYLFIGLRNATGELIEEGEVWFNDIKLGGVRKDIDHAERMSFSADFGNVLQVSGNWQRTGPEFRTMRQKSGNGVTSSTLSLQGKTRIDHFVPTAGFDLPVSVKYSNSEQLPKYIPQSDIEITDDKIRDKEKTVNNNYALTVSMSRRGSSNFLMRNLFDNLRSSFSYSKRDLLSPNARDTTWTISGNLNYSTNFSKERTLGLFKGVKWRYWLSSFSLQSSGSRKVRRYYTVASGSLVKRPETRDAQLNTNANMLYEPFESVKIDFYIAEKRNASIDHDFYGLPIGIQTNFNHNAKLTFQPVGRMFILDQLNPRFQLTTRYNEDLNPNLRQQNDPFGTRNVGAQRNINIVFDLDIGRYALGLGRRLNLIEEGERPERRSGRRTPFFKPPPGKKEFEENVERLRQQMEQKPAERGEVRQIEDTDREEFEKKRAEEEAAEAERLRQIAEAEGKKAAGGLDDLATRRPRDVRIDDQKTVPADSAALSADSLAVPADTTAAGPRRDPLIAVKQLVRFLGRFEPIKTSINIDHNSSYQRIYDRSSLLYQFGFTDNTGVPGKSGDIEDKPERASDNFTLGFRTAVDLTSNIKLDMKLNYGKRKDDYSGRVTESDRLTWPSLNMSWSGLERFALLQGLMKSSDVTMNFEQTRMSDGRREVTSTNLSPNWNFTMKNDLTMNLSYSFRQTTKIELGQEFWTRSWSVNLNARYNFSGSKGIGLPLPFLSSRKLRFQSTLTTNVNVGYSSTSKYNQPAANSLSISPTASYKFSKRMQGTLSVNYRRSSGGIYGYINHSIGLHITADFTF